MIVPSPLGTHGGDQPVTRAYAVTPSDTEDLPACPYCLILEVAGKVKMDLLGGSKAVPVPLQAGFNPIRPTKVYSTGTDDVGLMVAGY
jgi:hypothetical protein